MYANQLSTLERSMVKRQVKQVPPVKGTDGCPHKPILYVHSPRADLSDFGLLGEQSSPKWEIPCQERPWTTMQNLTSLALSSPEKFVTVHNYKITNKQTNKQLTIYPHPAYRHVWIMNTHRHRCVLHTRAARWKWWLTEPRRRSTGWQSWWCSR